ncbi:MAG: coproporphyrinogen-III oxidase family protein [Bradymonadaceae bacterium]
MGVESRPGSPAGLYVHLPLCASRCPYCEYPVSVERDPEAVGGAYVEAVLAEFDRHRSRVSGRDIRTLYIGGGTPSALADAQLARLIRELTARTGELTEVTLEVNPEDASDMALEKWVEAGVTRLILGLQSLQGEVLAALGRRHGPECARRAYRAAAAVEPGQLGVDLLFGAPVQTLSVWERDLDWLADAEAVDVATAHELTCEEPTPLGRAVERGRIAGVPAERRGEMLDRFLSVCRDRGWTRHEVATLGRSAAHGQHQRLYWTGGEYLGLGAGASGFLLEDGVPTRTTHPVDFARYVADPPADPLTESLDEADYLGERLALGLQSTVGIDLDVVEEQFAESAVRESVERAVELFDGWCERGMLERRGARYRPTDAGFRVLNVLERRVRRIA